MSIEALSVYRILYASYRLFVGSIPTYAWVAQTPPAFYDPPRYSLASFFDGFPDAAVFDGLSVAIPVLYVLLLFGYRTRLVCVLLFAALIVGDTFAYSLGKIDHDQVLHAYLVLILAFSPWGARYSLDAQRGRVDPAWRRSTRPIEAAWPVAMVALLLGFGYFSAGIGKAIHWLDFDLHTQGARRWLIHGFFVRDRQAFLAEAFVAFDAPILWELMDVLAVVFEVGFMFAVLHVAVFRTFVLAATVFHTINYLMLNIDFSGLYIIYLLFIPWKLLLPFLQAHVPQRAVRALLHPSVCVFVVVLMLGASVYDVFLHDDRAFEGFTPWMAILGRPGPWYAFVTFALSAAAVVLLLVLYVERRSVPSAPRR